MPTADKARPLPRILVVDDEAIVLESLAEWFKQDGYSVGTARNGKEALHAIGEDDYDIALLDIKMPGMDGLELQSRLVEQRPDLTIIIMTAYASVDSAVSALKAGAYDYITKPFDPEELSLLVRRASEHRSLQKENIRLKESIDAIAPSSAIIGDSPAMHRVLELIAAVAASDATALIKGESGTGKELVARAIHAQSARRYNPLVVVNCGALTESLLESELFGHEKGAFTGAQYRHKGKFELADGGTVFLDEIADIGPHVQVDLLRVLEDKTITRVGGTHPIPVSFRVVAATNKDLEAMVENGDFRDDLYWRLNVFTIEIPPLRERGGDIPLLAAHFIRQFTRSMNRPPMELAPEALDALAAYDWPGNVRELQNAIERAVVVGSPPIIKVGDLPARITTTEPAPGRRSLAEMERVHIASVLEANDWNISRSAEVLGIDRGTLYNKIKKYELHNPSHAAG
ncbi:MAG: sigma-54 dependent transcriptional regulator [Acidobacteriota bacterium]|jgi:DNA-binding NtrC family response regulator